jgi:hypothetical protein
MSLKSRKMMWKGIFCGKNYVEKSCGKYFVCGKSNIEELI